MLEDSAASAAAHFDGSGASLAWSIPFAGLLLSIALLPLVAHRFWEHHFGKVAAFWSFALIIPVVAIRGFWTATTEILHVFLLDYLPFIILLFALFVVAGGIRVSGNLVGTPATNTAMLAFGTLVGKLSRHDRRLDGADPPDDQGEPRPALSHPRLRIFYLSRFQYRRLAHAAWRSAALSRLPQGRGFPLDARGHAAAHAVHERDPACAVLCDRPYRLESRARRVEGAGVASRVNCASMARTTCFI